MRTVGLVIVVVAILFVGVLLINSSGLQNQNTNLPNPIPSPATDATEESASKEEVDIKASFTIITDNITRSFKAEKYHNQSLEVFITSADPNIILVKKKGVTWQDFFNTLPMQLTKECLITGDGETLCDGQQGTLKFYLNDVEEQALLDKEIKNNDHVQITFTSK